MDGCVLHEDYEATDGHKGESFSIYDASRQIWHQTWVTNAGKLLMIEGSSRNGEMALSGVDHMLDGKQRLVRGVWKHVREGVRETAITSYDGGKRGGRGLIYCSVPAGDKYGLDAASGSCRWQLSRKYEVSS